MQIRSPSGPTGLRLVLDVMTSYASPCPDIRSRLPVTSEPFLHAFMEASGATRSMNSYRAAVTHFTDWLGGDEKTLFAADAATIERFRTHDCHRTGRRSNKAHYRGMAVGIISRLLLFLQYQGLTRSNGWGGDDAGVCMAFRDAMIAQGLLPDRATVLALQAAHAIIWMRLAGVERSQADDVAMGRFVDHVCNCGFGAGKGEPGLYLRRRRQLGFWRFMKFLRGEDPVLAGERLVRVSRGRCPTLTESVESWLAWLAHRRGLSPQTLASYRLEILRWHEQLGEEASRYSAELIRDVARRALEGRSPTGQSRFITVMRSYLRFRVKRGECQSALVGALISRNSYRLGTVPRSLPFDTIRDVIAGCDRDTPMGLRDRAVLILLLESGMRGGEAAQLRLSDLDWNRSQVRVRGKGGRGSAKPLTQGIGEALLDWLEFGRPRTESDAVFVRLRRPITFLSRTGVTQLVQAAFARAGLAGVGGAHVVRHSFARALLKDGAALHDIGGALGHASSETTMIYAKVDENALKGIARPWLGDVR